MPAPPRLRDGGTTGGAGRYSPVAEVTGGRPGINPLAGNMGTADVRYNAEATMVITLLGFDGTDSFKLRYRPQGTDDVQDTVAFVRGTNATAAAIQAAIRAMTGVDTTCTVAGTTDAGPFTVTWVGNLNVGLPLFEAVELSGCAAVITKTAPSYIAGAGRHTATLDGNWPAASQTPSLPGETDMEAVDIPLGFSTTNGETVGVALPPPAITAAAGATGAVSLTATEEGTASGAVVLYVLKNKDTGAMHTVETEDADGTVTISGLDAGEWLVYAYTQTVIAADPDPLSARVSRPSDPAHFTVT